MQLINGLDPVLAAGLDSGCLRVLTMPMSYSGRKLLNKNLHQLIQKYAQKLGLTQVKAIAKFADTFDRIRYESVAQQFDIDGYPGTGKNSKWPDQAILKSMSLEEQFAYCANLEHFTNATWLSEHNPKHKHHVGSVTNEATAAVYNWITSKFLVSDFSDFDLNKICEMGSSIFDLNTIIKYADQIYDPQKRSVSYLYAIARDASLKESVSRSRLAEEEARQKESFMRALDYIKTPRSPFIVTEDDYSSIDRTAEYMRILRESKEND